MNSRQQISLYFPLKINGETPRHHFRAERLPDKRQILRPAGDDPDVGVVAFVTAAPKRQPDQRDGGHLARMVRFGRFQVRYRTSDGQRIYRSWLVYKRLTLAFDLNLDFGSGNPAGEQADHRRRPGPASGKDRQARRRRQAQTRDFFQQSRNTGSRRVTGRDLEYHFLVGLGSSLKATLRNSAKDLGTGFREFGQIKCRQTPGGTGNTGLGKNQSFSSGIESIEGQ